MIERTTYRFDGSIAHTYHTQPLIIYSEILSGGGGIGFEGTKDPPNVQSLSVFKGTEATDKFGLQGKNGVVLIELKEGMLDKMPVELSGRFK